ncbi:MAG: hypothetical protein P8M51_01130 [Flavobacteriaceae bacterium]|nr:hypothetical protein [Flavobacteriaceae bacterium]
MVLDEDKKQEIIELLEIVISDDTHLYHSLNNSNVKSFYSKEELEKTIVEISSKKMQKIFEEKLSDYKSDRKKFLMEKYGKFLLSERLVRSTINSPLDMKKRYSIFKKYY